MQWECLGSGRNRQVWRRIGSNYVVKVPLNEAGFRDNMLEHMRYRGIGKGKKRSRNAYLAPCRLLPTGCLLMLHVEHVGFSKESDWTWSIDCGQVGKDNKGRLLAYDYGN